ncbi:protein of unknown function [Amycolatopsis marina]|uniref:DUF222 domain-containing protein n=1 Tax=Amycolatopsis marina TaxID=490629 RepID=A0A1I1CGG6_9PSEU|nr:protein of unknown function [Amycolatopsis marina]
MVVPGLSRRRSTLVARLQSVERTRSRMEARQLCDIAELVSTSPGTSRDVAQEVALALSVTPRAAERMVSLAVALTTRLPHTLAAMRAGVVDGYKASKIADVTGCLSDDLARLADERLSQRLAGKDPTQLRRAAHHVVAQVDPDGYAKRVARRRAERSVQLVQQGEGMATLIADLPTETATSIYARIDREARRLRHAGATATLDQLRADLFGKLCLRDGTGSGAARAEVFVYVAATTLLELDHEPAEMTGHGYIPAWLARQIATGPNTTWRRILTDPITGHPIDLGRTRYRPTAPLDEFVRIRDRECRAPGVLPALAIVRARPQPRLAQAWHHHREAPHQPLQNPPPPQRPTRLELHRQPRRQHPHHHHTHQPPTHHPTTPPPQTPPATTALIISRKGVPGWTIDRSGRCPGWGRPLPSRCWEPLTTTGSRRTPRVIPNSPSSPVCSVRRYAGPWLGPASRPGPGRPLETAGHRSAGRTSTPALLLRWSPGLVCRTSRWSPRWPYAMTRGETLARRTMVQSYGQLRNLDHARCQDAHSVPTLRASPRFHLRCQWVLRPAVLRVPAA